MGGERSLVQSPARVQHSYREGMQKAGLQPAVIQVPPNCSSSPDRLKMKEKERLISVLLQTILSGDQVVASELALLRASGAALHLPLSLTALASGISGNDGGMLDSATWLSGWGNLWLYSTGYSI